MATKHLNEGEYGALAEFRYRLRCFLAFSEGQARDAGLKPQQHQFLLALKGFGGRAASLGMIAERLVLRHHSTVELADRLEQRGMIVRQRSNDDGRLAQIQITARGAEALRRLSIAHRDELRRAGPQLARALATVLKGNFAPLPKARARTKKDAAEAPERPVRAAPRVARRNGRVALAKGGANDQ